MVPYKFLVIEERDKKERKLKYKKKKEKKVQVKQVNINYCKNERKDDESGRVSDEFSSARERDEVWFVVWI